MRKIRVEPAVWEAKLVSDTVDGIFHGGGCVNDGVHIGSHIAEAVIGKNRSAADQDNFCGHCCPVQFAEFFGKRFQIGVKIVFGKIVRALRGHPAPRFPRC
ncbi:hypothetical protein SDC9_193856 [bioreactor metagenome]|uniref:Uncharacterized protein n=1 Tax=bioreactor metagenome TaxID=1076179 RepID=A0A645I4P9_9ZZZZ